ncbi:MAG: nucleoside-diphosphate sugar epimerase [Candidatus Omnitrophica bacterium CG08_land_8_20_14_0_20_41_16]|uniref:Nucleoside-diphosphate sugar epimerase n=1 Tax=Candidatus Sherwoodlollariibacterium unditelluris TaxID=1974757 RepID=A0A2G9YJN5_9BACT|nr:MAG: nucleoside-diphosphate sugar epimerase [Candidatus Omnitrophica bacterium CG23_combo_of_CG06-09_8_20_14_all_41_10]PIS33759.1 MAG: nucleoside-diphosphate sugar epimerase [Candidatus Omnitrophica bacterium CG08_land_8_20_14_0_20_41_16]
MNLKELILKCRRLIIIVIHFALVVGAYILAFYLRFDFKIDNGNWQVILKTLPILVCIKMVIFGYFGLYSGLWRYASVDDIWRIFKAHVLAALCFILAVAFIHTFVGFPRSIFALDFIISFFFITGIRFANRLVREKFRPEYRTNRKKALIVGAGEAGVMVLRESRINPKTNIEIVGFIDDDRRKRNLRIQGVSILGACSDIPAIVEEYGVEEIIIAIPSAKGEEIRSIIAHCKIPFVKIRIVPGLQKIISGDLEVKPREIKPEDLLGRETVTINEKEIKDYLFEKVVLVIGAGGSIGSALCRQIVNFNPKEILLFDHNENDVYYLGIEFLTKYRHIKFRTIIGDIKDIGLLKSVFSLYRPEIVFHTAAHKHVPLMEENPAAAVKNNIIGSRNLIYAANHYKVERFIFISTDKAVNPTSVMGMTKRIVEMILQSKAKISRTKYMAVRFGNVLGSDGSVIPLFKRQIEEGGPLTITHPEVKRYFMSINEASQLVLQAGSMGKAGEIFILDMGEQIKILDLAKEMIILYGLKPDEDIKIEYIGLRPGEKLFEETLLDTEKDKATKADKIYIAELDAFDPRLLRERIKDLERVVKVMDSAAIVKKLQEIIRI